MLGAQPLTVLLVSPNRDVAIDTIALIQPWPNPVLEGQQFELFGAPPRARARQEISVFAQPKVKVAMRIKPLNSFSEEPLKFRQELVDLGQLFSRIGEEIFNVKT